ncbi:MAG: hypothetical protein CVU17_00865 [Betaproteobacteria bacterium HGW-Betaproteobacteria-11]|nr:MAG: hypothetical protein CVU17_00865 [Betaproteobacteria bacterium HGW-Betaproteobacteria-11]
MRQARCLALTLACLGLGACAELPAPEGEFQAGKAPANPESTASPPETIVLGPPLERFVADGRIALKNGERHDHLGFHWQHSSTGDRVLFLSPLGQGLAEIERDAGGARLTQPNRPPIVASDLRLLTQDVLGTALPLEALADWLRGAHPRLQGEVDGWRVSVTDSVVLDSPSGQRRLLRALEARREQIELRLIVDDWTLDE